MVFKSFSKKDKIMSKDEKKVKEATYKLDSANKQYGETEYAERRKQLVIREIDLMRVEIEKRLKEIAEQPRVQTIEAESKIKEEQKLKLKKLPIGKELDSWIIKKHKEKGIPLDAIDLKDEYRVDFGRHPDMFDLTESYGKLIKRGAFIVVGIKTLYKENR